MSIKSSPTCQRGVTLIELVIFIVIVSVAVAATLSVLTSIGARSADPVLRKQAMLRAESLIEEVALAHFTFCHPDDTKAETATSSADCATLPEAFSHAASEARPYYNINDYVTGASAPTSFTWGDPTGDVVTDVTGASMLPTGYRALVTITPVGGFGPAGMQIGTAGGSADTDVLHISVDVRYGDNQHIVLDRYRTRYAPNYLP